MKKTLLFPIILLCCTFVWSQNSTATDSAYSKAFMVVEQMPEFPGGQNAMYKYLYDHMKYPQNAKDSDIEGTVYVKFIITETGEVTDPVCTRDIGGGCGASAVAAVENMPAWNPGVQQGKRVPVVMTLPFKFVLDDGHHKKKK